MQDNTLQKGFEKSSSFIEYSSIGSHSDKFSFFNSKTHFPQKSCQGIISPNIEPVSKQNLTTLVFSQQPLLSEQSMSETFLQKSAEPKYINKEDINHLLSHNFLPEFVPMIQQIVRIQKMYTDKVLEVEGCRKKIEELEQEKEEFKPMKLIHSYEAKLKEKQNVIDVLERRIHVLQKKASNGEKSSDSMISSDSFISLSTPQSLDNLSAGQNQETDLNLKIPNVTSTLAQPQNDIQNPKGVSSNAQGALDSQNPKGVSSKVYTAQLEPSACVNFEAKENQQSQDLERKDAEKKNPDMQVEKDVPESIVNESPGDSAKKARKPRTTKPKENQNQDEKAPGKKKISSNVSPPTPTPTQPTDNQIVAPAKPASGRKRKEMGNENTKAASSIVAQMNDKAKQKENEKEDETISQTIGLNYTIPKDVLSHEICGNIPQDQQIDSIKENGESKQEFFNTSICENDNVSKHTCEEIIIKEPFSTTGNEDSSKNSSNERVEKENLAKKMKSIENTESVLNESKVEKPEMEQKKLQNKEKKQSSLSLNYQQGQKINVSEYQIVCLKTKAGKILEYYMNKTDELVYKKVSDGMIGVKVGHISEFGKFDSNGHFVLNS